MYSKHAHVHQKSIEEKRKNRNGLQNLDRFALLQYSSGIIDTCTCASFKRKTVLSVVDTRL